MNKSIVALGIESSCDDTAIGLVRLTYKEPVKKVSDIYCAAIGSYIFDQKELLAKNSSLKNPVVKKLDWGKNRKISFLISMRICGKKATYLGFKEVPCGDNKNALKNFALIS